MTFNRILIAVDDEPVAAHAVEIGIALAHSLHANAALIHVMERPARWRGHWRPARRTGFPHTIGRPQIAQRRTTPLIVKTCSPRIS